MTQSEFLQSIPEMIGVLITKHDGFMSHINQIGETWLQMAQFGLTSFCETLQQRPLPDSSENRKFTIGPFEIEQTSAVFDGERHRVFYFGLKRRWAEANLQLDLQLKSIEIDQREYELSLFRSLINEMAGRQEILSITTKFIEFCCGHFLFSQGFYFDFKSHLETRLATVYPNRDHRIVEEKWEQAQLFMRNHRPLLSDCCGRVSEHRDSVVSFFNLFESLKIAEVFCYPVIIKGNLIGTFLFATQDGHHGCDTNTLSLMIDLIEIVKPTINNAILMELSLTDELSSLRNRRMFDLTFQSETEAALKNKSPLSLILIDIDHFKKINDGFGHGIGDMAIKHLAQLLRKSIRQLDGSFRYGGEEFAILVRGTAKTAESIARRVNSALLQSPLMLENLQPLTFTISQGIAQFDDSWTLSQFFEKADQSLYASKKNGRNQYTIYPGTLT